MENQNSDVFVFKNHFDAENAIRLLNNSSFNMKHLSVIGKGYHTEEHPIGFYTKGDRIIGWGKFGAFWGAIWGLIFAPAVFLIPGFGVMALAGPVVTALVSALESAVIAGSLTALGSAMLELGVQKDQVIKYEVAIKADQFLLLVHGSNDEIEHAHSVLKGPNKQISFNN